jgi:hypothetical protein
MPSIHTTKQVPASPSLLSQRWRETPIFFSLASRDEDGRLRVASKETAEREEVLAGA